MSELDRLREALRRIVTEADRVRDMRTTDRGDYIEALSFCRAAASRAINPEKIA